MHESHATSPLRALLAALGAVAIALALVPLASPAGAQPGPPTQLDLEINEGLDISDALQTSILFSQLQFSDGGVDDVVLTTSETGADALSSGVLAEDTPILYFDPTEGVNDAHVDEIERLGASNVIIVGGVDRIPADVEDALEDLGLTTERLDGVTRIETAHAVAAYHFANDTGADTASVHVSRAFGTETNDDTAFADAAGLGAWAAQSDVATVLTQVEELSQSNREFYTAFDNIDTSVAVGGTEAVSDNVLQTLEEEFDQTTDRVNSPDNDNRAGTAVAVNEARGLDPATVEGIIFLDGYADDFFIDAYVLAGLAANNNHAVLLTNGDDLPPETQAYVDAITATQALDLIATPNVTDVAVDAIEDATGATLEPAMLDGDPARIDNGTLP